MAAKQTRLMSSGIRREGVVEFAPLIDVGMAGFKVHLGENHPEFTSRCLDQWTQLNGG